jgi:hypothetical protein
MDPTMYENDFLPIGDQIVYHPFRDMAKAAALDGDKAADYLEKLEHKITRIEDFNWVFTPKVPSKEDTAYTRHGDNVHDEESEHIYRQPRSGTYKFKSAKQLFKVQNDVDHWSKVRDQKTTVQGFFPPYEMKDNSISSVLD